MARVKPKRQYTSVLRQQQARETRARILDAAQNLFSTHGYGATTMEAIAAEAGVATDTIYASFRNKAGVLHKLLDVRVGGDDAPVRLIDRGGPQRVKAQPTQQGQIASFASDIAQILERARPVDEIMRGAATIDPEVAELRARMQGLRYDNLKQFVGWLGARGPLRGGINEEAAAAIVWTLASPEVHGLLRDGRGWSQERFVAWLGDSLTRILLH